MVSIKRPKTIKKVTEIPNATVTIEVEEKEDVSAVVEEKVETQTPKKTQAEDVVENFNDQSAGYSWKKIFLIILIVVPIGFLAFGGFLYFSQNLNSSFLKPQPKKTITLPEIIPTPTKVVIDKEAYTIEIQNGSGIAGEGAKVKSTLESEGFKVGTVGNADNSNYTDTMITVNDNVSDGYIEELRKTLEERGPVEKTEKFATGQDGEVLIIIGSSVSQTSPTLTP
jgi:hypothetical protein